MKLNLTPGVWLGVWKKYLAFGRSTVAIKLVVAI